MATKISKNARKGVKTQMHYCSCGGEIRMKTIFRNGKMNHRAVCQSCKKEERRPSDFK